MGYHYHILIYSKLGISKNTYKQEYREAFRLFTGMQLDVRGVKSKRNSYLYLTKDLSIKELIAFFKGKEESKLYAAPAEFWYGELLKVRKFKHLGTLLNITKFENYDEWSLRSLQDYDRAMVKPNYSIKVWETKEEIFSNSITPLWDLLGKYENTFKGDDLLNNILKCCYKYDITRDHLAYLRHVIFGLIVRENLLIRGDKGFIVKGKALLLTGKPNTGKTSLLTKLSEVFNRDKRFYFVGSRPNDFRGYRVHNNPVIVWDDVFKLDGTTRWNNYNILKLLAHESVSVDVKYRRPVKTVPSYNIILSNHVKIYWEIENMAIKVRIKHVHVRRIPKWTLITKEEIELFMLNIIENLFVELTSSTLRRFINYGIHTKYRISRGEVELQPFHYQDKNPTSKLKEMVISDIRLGRNKTTPKERNSTSGETLRKESKVDTSVYASAPYQAILNTYKKPIIYLVEGRDTL